MNEPTTIYVVTCGDYSDYGIDAMFSTREKAEKYMEHSVDFSGSMRIEEYVLDSEEPDMSEKLYEVRINYNTFDNKIYNINSSDSLDTDVLTNSFQMISDDIIHIWVLTTDQKRAIKIASERLGQIKAQEWKYPLMHNKCTFVTEREYKCLLTIDERYPIYRFYSGEMALYAGERLVEYTIKDKKTREETTIEFK